MNGADMGGGWFNVQSGATLGGTGSLANALISSNAILSPGNSPGTLTFSNLTLSAGAIVTQEIASASLYDVVVATNLTVEGTVTWNLTLTGTVLPNGSQLPLFDVGSYGGSITNNWLSQGGTNLLSEGSVFVLMDTNGASEQFQISYSGGDGNNITLTAIPEPGSVILITILGLGLYSWRRLRGWS